MHLFNKELKKFENTLQKTQNNNLYDYAKVVSLTYLTCEIEKVLTNPKNKNPVKDIVKIINNAKNIYKSLSSLFIFQLKVKKKFVKNSFEKNHELLWQKIWPDYENKKNFLNLIKYRGTRLDFNRIKSFKDKEILDVGCGNGSISFGCLFRGAKGGIGVDFGENNIKFAKYWAKKFKFNKKITFYKKNILNLNLNKKFDFIICSAVLHHLKNHNQMYKVFKKISLHCKKGGFFYFFIRGKGGMRYAIQDFCQKALKNISHEYIKKILQDLNFKQHKITHVLDWHTAIYLQSDKSKILSVLKNLGFNKFKRLKGPHKNDMDINQLNTHLKSNLKFGTGELRFICEKIN